MTISGREAARWVALYEQGHADWSTTNRALQEMGFSAAGVVAEIGEHPHAAIFRDNHCWKCNDGERSCAQGGANHCEYPHARND